MKKENFIKAIEILAKFHTSEIIINNANAKSANINNMISIKNCCAAAINVLINEGYSLYMVNGLLVIDDYAIA